MSTATDMLAAYVAAEQAVLEGKKARIGDDELHLEDLDRIQAGRREWERRVAQETSAASGAPSFGGIGYSVGRFDS